MQTDAETHSSSMHTRMHACTHPIKEFSLSIGAAYKVHKPPDPNLQRITDS
jgi:hypothetical protein